MSRATMANPLTTLGLSPALVSHEAGAGRLSRIMKIAKGQYKLLSRYYHPDHADGDAQIMSSLTEAINELDDLDTLEYYVDELLGEVDTERDERQRILREREVQRQRAYQSTVQLLQYSNQFEVFGITAPTSFLIDFMDMRAIVDVLAPDKTMFSLAGSNNSEEIPGLYARFEAGVWSESLTDKDLPDRRVHYTHVRSLGEIRVIGGVAPALSNGLESGPILNSGGLLEGIVPQGVSWSEVTQSWFMPHLGPYHNGDHVVMMKNGLVAITGFVLASALIK